MDFKGRISGHNDLDRTFSNLVGSTRRRAYMSALRDGAKVVKKAAEENIRSVVSNEATGFLAKNIRIYNYRKRRGNYRVGVQIARTAVNKNKIVKGQPVRAGLYGSVLEYGKKNQPPRSWIRKAIREKKDEAINLIRTSMNRGIVKAVQDAKR